MSITRKKIFAVTNQTGTYADSFRLTSNTARYERKSFSPNRARM